jgi:site-specific DNA-cytosine methylase
VEIDPFCQKVLAKHWPNVRRWDDVRTFPPEPTDDWRCDVICGGFPCQDISLAGKGAGLAGERSGLWVQFSRIVCLLRPRFVVVENVSALLIRGLGRVLGDLAACGYDAEWDCIPAAAVGAPHIRDRVFIVSARDSANSNVSRLFASGRATTTRQAKGVQGASKLNQWVKLWPTESATDWKGIYNPETVARRASESTRGVRLPEQVSRDEGNSGELNPTWVEWLMGFPLGWTALEDSATPSCPRLPSSSDAA